MPSELPISSENSWPPPPIDRGVIHVVLKRTAVEHHDMGERTADRDTPENDDRRRPDRDETVEFIATSTVRVGLLLLGVMLLLYSVGQAIGFDVLALISQALDTPEARWLFVAFFALILISIALRGFRS